MSSGKLLTWDEFKRHVDEHLTSCGEEGSIEIRYIDFAWIDSPSELNIFINEESGIESGSHMGSFTDGEERKVLSIFG